MKFKHKIGDIVTFNDFQSVDCIIVYIDKGNTGSKPYLVIPLEQENPSDWLTIPSIKDNPEFVAPEEYEKYLKKYEHRNCCWSYEHTLAPIRNLTLEHLLTILANEIK